MPEFNEAIEKTYRDYLAQVADLDPAKIAEPLGAEMADQGLHLPLLGNRYIVSANGVSDPAGQRPSHSVSVVLCKYLILCPPYEPRQKDWITYREFKDAAPFVGGFINNTEMPIARYFTGKLAELDQACRKSGGTDPDEGLPYELARRFEVLPKVPIMLLFNDDDEEFPAHCSLLFERRAEQYLDMECLAILGWLLSDQLAKAAGLGGDSIM